MIHPHAKFDGWEWYIIELLIDWHPLDASIRLQNSQMLRKSKYKKTGMFEIELVLNENAV